MKALPRYTICTVLAAALAVPAAVATKHPGNGNARFLDVVVSLERPQGKNAMSHHGAKSFAGSVARSFGITPDHTYGTVFAGFSASVPEQAVEALRNNPQVQSVSLDGTVQAAVQPKTREERYTENTNRVLAKAQTLPWGVDRVDADLNGNDGAGTHVYVIDTGIDSDHPDLQGNLGNGFAAVNCTFTFLDLILGSPHDCHTNWDDDHGHGTHVSGSVGAIDNGSTVVGVAPGVTLHAVKVLDGLGSGSFSDIIAGIDWVASEAAGTGTAVVANMSLGGSGSKTGSCDNGTFTGDDNLHRAICEAADVGVVFAVAAGNDGADASGSVPAAYDDSVITVSATNDSDDWASFSNWGDNSAAWTPHDSAPVAIAAPGVDVLSTWFDGGTNTLSGTSMASPHVAGGAALYITTNAQSGDFSAFTNTRQGLLSADESTDGFANTSGNPHDEDFLDAGSL